jgi:integrase
MLDAPDPSTLTGLRERAVLAVGFFAGPRRSSIVKLKVRDFYKSAGYDSLRFQIKGGTDHIVVIHPEAVQRIREYVQASGHEADLDGALFRDTRVNTRRWGRHLNPDYVWRLVKRYARQLGLGRHYGAHSMRATFITTALDCGAALDRVQEAASHADPKTTMSYDRRGFSPEHAASLKVIY